jgi:hypothetical protein
VLLERSEFSKSETSEKKSNDNKISDLENKITKLEFQLSNTMISYQKGSKIRVFHELFSR